jgi:hypothetical protein
LDGGNKHYCGWKRTYKQVEEDGCWEVVVVFVVFEAAFPKIQRRKSAHAKRAFLAVIAGTQAAEEFYNSVDGDDCSKEVYHCGNPVGKYKTCHVKRNPYCEGKIASYYKVFWELYGFADFLASSSAYW